MAKKLSKVCHVAVCKCDVFYSSKRNHILGQIQLGHTAQVLWGF